MDIVLRKELSVLDDIQKASSGWTRNYDYSNLCKPSKILGYWDKSLTCNRSKECTTTLHQLCKTRFMKYLSKFRTEHLMCVAKRSDTYGI